MFQFRRFPSYAYFVQRRMTGYCPAGLPHSDIPGSMDICSSPRLFAACHVLLRLLMPRHSPCALSSLTYRRSHSDLSENSWFSLRIMQALQRSKLYVTLHPFGCCSTINLFPLCLHRETSLLPYLLLSHCSVFKVQIAVRKLSLVSGTASNRFCSQILRSDLSIRSSNPKANRLVGPSGLEPPTLRLSVVRSSQLSYGPSSWTR